MSEHNKGVYYEIFSEADARLIAAAPELLAACERLTAAFADMIKGVSVDDCGNLLIYIAPEDVARAAIDAAREIVAKAKGATP